MRTQLLLISALLSPFAAGSTIVFQTDFESSLPAEISAPGASIQFTQGYGSLTNPANPGSVFNSTFLRYDASTRESTTLTLTGLPAHESVSIGMLLAVIDSWDGSELLEMRLDGQLLFSHTFQLASSADTSSYVPPVGGLLSSGTDLGFNSIPFFVQDRAYDLSLDPDFQDIPHSSSSLTLEITLDAVPGTAPVNWQSGTDESWAIDNLVET